MSIQFSASYHLYHFIVCENLICDMCMMGDQRNAKHYIHKINKNCYCSLMYNFLDFEFFI